MIYPETEIELAEMNLKKVLVKGEWIISPLDPKLDLVESSSF